MSSEAAFLSLPCENDGSLRRFLQARSCGYSQHKPERTTKESETTKGTAPQGGPSEPQQARSKISKHCCMGKERCFFLFFKKLQTIPGHSRRHENQNADKQPSKHFICFAIFGRGQHSQNRKLLTIKPCVGKAEGSKGTKHNAQLATRELNIASQRTSRERKDVICAPCSWWCCFRLILCIDRLLG